MVRRIDDLCRRFPTWNDEMLLQALRRRPACQAWPSEMLKGLILMKTLTVSRMKRNNHSKKETGVQTDRLPSQWKVMNRVRVQVQEQLIVVREQVQSGHDEETLETGPEFEVGQMKEKEQSNDGCEGHLFEELL